MFKLENNTSTQFDSPEEAARLADAFTFGLIDKLLEKGPALFVKFMTVKKQFEAMMKAESEAEAKAKAEAEAKAKAEAEAKAKAEAEAEEKAAQEKAEEPWSNYDKRINRLEAMLRRLSKKLDLE